MEVILYSTGCPTCIRMKELLESKRIPFEYMSKTAEEMQKLGFSSTPILTVDGKIYHQVDALRWIFQNA